MRPVTRLFFSITAVLLASHDAHAFVRSRTKAGIGTPISWRSFPITMTPTVAGTVDLPSAEVLTTFQRSIDNWLVATDVCTDAKLVLAPAEAIDALFNDKKNVIVFRGDRWCHPEDAEDVNKCYDASAAAITSVFYIRHPGHDDDGKVTDTDVELNNLNFTFVIAPSPSAIPRPGTQISDLENVLTHELGHVLGLDHTCADGNTEINAVDEKGIRPPDCTNLGGLSTEAVNRILDATMYNNVSPNGPETKKRSPEPDDVAGVCAIYPIGGCSMTTRPSETPIGLACLGALCLCLYLRRFI